MKGRKLFALHSILGLITGVLLLVISLSGSILVFSDEIDHALNTDILKVTPRHEKVSLDSAYRTALKSFPGGFVRIRQLPAQSNHSIEFSVEKGENWTFAYINPYTGKLTGSRNARTYFIGWVLLLHYSLLGGTIGELLVAILSITLMLSVITGLVVYRKHLFKVITFKIKFSFSNWRKASSSLHRIIGVWSLIFNLIFAITGFWMLRYVFQPSTYQQQSKQQLVNTPFSVSLDSLVHTSKSTFKGFAPAAVLLPESKEDNMRIYGAVSSQNSLFDKYSNFIEFQTDQVKEVRRSNITSTSLMEQWDAIDYTLHSGHWGNTIIKLIYCLAGLTPGLLSITGFALWYRKKKRR
ncbi:PepSY-associated TM helix domain-containing protein [Desertivirga arenae]|uniref:PepSY-associated TM helix domain-containing protein n=1 Tax=Desertivirga arenae TaxID=2810309 RepID=UPI001A95CED1|nr:PepSY-associated TM helix domain-containing protein [Pedobacter sp. SYSU D00823]